MVALGADKNVEREGVGGVSGAAGVSPWRHEATYVIQVGGHVAPSGCCVYRVT